MKSNSENQNTQSSSNQTTNLGRQTLQELFESEDIDAMVEVIKKIDESIKDISLRQQRQIEEKNKQINMLESELNKNG